MRRVVITRAGVIAPNADSLDLFSTALRNGLSGLLVIDYFEPDKFFCRIAGQIPGFDKSALLKRFPVLERVGDNKVFFGIHAFLEMMGNSEINGDRCAANLGTSLESFLIEKIFKLSPFRFDIDKYLEGLETHKNDPYLQVPLDYLGSFLKKNFGLTCPNYLNCSTCTASTQAIGHSFHMIRNGRYDRVVTGGFDSMLNPLGIGGQNASIIIKRFFHEFSCKIKSVPLSKSICL